MHEIKNSSAANEHVPEVCPNCTGSQFDTEWRKQSFQYGKPGEAVELVAKVPVHVCRACEFEFTGEEAEEARHEAVCRHLGVLSPRQIVGLRKSYGMSRAEFAELSRVGTASLARWEAAILIQNPANDQLLYLLHYKENVDRLRNRRSPDVLPTLQAAAESTGEMASGELADESHRQFAASTGARVPTFCRHSVRGTFRAIGDLEQRRTVARTWDLRDLRGRING
jgi:DNA-binding transcriptional regulator YiaG